MPFSNSFMDNIVLDICDSASAFVIRADGRLLLKLTTILKHAGKLFWTRFGNSELHR
ncbi:unnamed protein product [Larinioides sclopetarius]|uniref:Uncharacterized protein n=1 Tax=Larinioides sclopetarius TaxID=280406 RepID=A0AAV1Z529_9ARAC